MPDRADQNGDVLLTPREIEVVRLIALGYDRNELGVELKISPRTVDKHVRHMVAKLGARNRPHLVALALAHNLIESVPIIPVVGSGDGALA